MADPSLKNIDQQLAEAEAKVNKLRTVREILADDELRAMVVSALDGSLPNGTTKRRVRVVKKKYRKRGGSVFEKLQGYFTATGNQWSTLDDIVAATKLGKPSIRQTVYMAHPDVFERRAGEDRKTQFRLKASQVA